MEETTTKKTKTFSEKMCSMRDCEQCGHRHQHHYIFRMLLTLFVVITAFWCGLKIGELKGFIIASQTSPRPIHFKMMPEEEGFDMQSRKMNRPTTNQPTTESIQPAQE